MSRLRVAFSCGPLDRMVIDAGDEERSGDPWTFLPRYVFRATHHGRVGATGRAIMPTPQAIYEWAG